MIGRKKIFTSVKEIDYNNVIDVLRRAFGQHIPNAARMKFLFDYESGLQPLKRKEGKKHRSDIDCHCIDNLAHEAVEFHLGFDWGNPITLVQRGERDSGNEDESLPISALNENYEAENFKTKQQEVARDAEICGLGYEYVETRRKSEWEEGDSYFSLCTLSPFTTFIVYSNYYIDKRAMMGVTYRHYDETGDNFFTCYTNDRVFEIENLFEIVNGEISKTEEKWQHAPRSGVINPLGKIPIIEWYISHDRTGCFEHVISEMDNLNLMISDFSNDVEQNTQAIWHTNDVDFPKRIIKTEEGEIEEKMYPKSHEWMQTYTTENGKNPFVEALSINYDYPGMLQNIELRRSYILEKCNVPGRGGAQNSTGVATDSALGYTAAEDAARKKQNIMESCKMMEVDVVLRAIKASLVVQEDNPLLTLRKMDVKPKVTRQRSYELSVKTTAMATMLSHGISGLHAIRTVNLFEDANQVWADSKDLIEKYQDSIFSKSESTNTEEITTTDGGYNAQVTNSPLIDGMSKQEPVQDENGVVDEE